MILTWLLFVICLTVFPNNHGCGLTPFGQGRTINFTLSSFKLPAAMAYSEKPGVTSKVPTISTTKQNAETFIRNLIMRSVEEVLYDQGRRAGLSGDVISLILQQLTVNITYNPLKCDDVNTNPTAAAFGGQNVMNCIIIGDTVISTCMTAANDMCQLPMNEANHKPIDSQQSTISGSLMTTNIIMANWTNQMWQNVLNRVLRSLASGPFGKHFSTASVTIN